MSALPNHTGFLFRRHLKASSRAVILAVLACCMAAGVVGMLLPERYRAEARVIEGQAAPVQDEASASQRFAGVEGIVRSRESLAGVARDLDLASRPAQTILPGGFLQEVRTGFGLLADPAVLSDPARLIEAMDDSLEVLRDDSGRGFVIRFSAGDPGLAASVANALADRFVALRKDAGGLQLEARVVTRATAPTEPYFPSMVRIVGMAFLVSLVFAGAIAVIVAFLHARRRMNDDLLTPIAQVGMPAPSMAELASPAAPVPYDGISTEAAAERLIAGGSSRAVFVSPRGDEAAFSSVLVAREIADAGLRALFLDLTASGAASAPMVTGHRQLGITNLLASEALFSEVIHADRHSDCHVIPLGTSDPARAMRAADRLPIILQSLVTAYDIVVVECGPAEPGALRRLAGESTTILVSATETTDVVTRLLEGLHAAGYGDILLVRSDQAALEPDEDRSVA